MTGGESYRIASTQDPQYPPEVVFRSAERLLRENAKLARRLVGGKLRWRTGSRFDVEGTALEGLALRPLAQVDVGEPEREPAAGGGGRS
jgi:hypothetical protein